MTEPSASQTPARRRLRDNPWWIPPFLGTIPVLEPRLMRTLQLLALGMMIENYDLSLINSTLKYIMDDLGIATTDSGFYMGIVRLGGILTFLILPFADRIGRRRVFLAALIMLSLGTLFTAFAQTPWQFVAIQFVTRAAMLTVVATALVIASEEFPAEHRGWAIGILAALAGFGYGIGALLFSAIEVLPYGWRALYALGCVPLLLLPRFRRDLKETRRFEAHRESVGSTSETGVLMIWLGPLMALARSEPRRTLSLGTAALLSAAGGIAVFQYSAEYALRVHGWEPWQYSAMVIGGGVIGIMGNVVAGRLGDRIGRRWIGFLFLLPYPLFAALYYNGPSWTLWVGFGAIVFCGSVGEVIQRAFVTELFATSHRGAAAGALILAQTAGWSLGLMLFSLAADNNAALPTVITGLSLLVAIAGVCFLFLPETNLRELEETSGETGRVASEPS